MMNKIQKLIQKIDARQRGHSWLGFPYAVMKKYGEDQGGYQSALLTYYGFLSLFPLLIVLTTLVSLTTGQHHALQTTIINSITDYFPKLGSQLSAHVHSLHKSGVALLVGVVLTFYGAHGVADVFRYSINHIWQIPIKQRDGFPKSTIKSLSIVIVGGLGFMLASLLAGYAGTVGHGFGFRLLSLAINAFILFCLFGFLLNTSLPHHVSIKQTWAGGAFAAIVLVLLQSVGSYLLARELKNLDSLYSTFAIALGLLYWLYLQAEVLYYAVVIAAVHSQKLWPRALDAKNPTQIDKQIYAKHAMKEAVLESETITADFSS
jgi:YihY family inner membrane protein